MTIILLTLSLAAGLLIGALAGRRSGFQLGYKEGHYNATRELADPQPICACDHNYAFHDPESNSCHGVTLVKQKGEPIMSPGGTYVVSHKAGTTIERPCTCRRYTGPEPLPRYIA